MSGATVRRACPAGLLTAVLLAGLTACTGDGTADSADLKNATATPAACADGTYAWSGIRRTTLLTRLADPIRISKQTSSLKVALKPLSDTTYRPTVSGAPAGVGAAGVIKALGAHLKTAEPLADLSQSEDPEVQYVADNIGHEPGAYYAWTDLGLVDADFTYTCAGIAIRGRVRTWERTGEGFLPCSDPALDEASRAAARESCPAGSEAVEGTP